MSTIPKRILDTVRADQATSLEKLIEAVSELSARPIPSPVVNVPQSAPPTINIPQALAPEVKVETPPRDFPTYIITVRRDDKGQIEKMIAEPVQ